MIVEFTHKGAIIMREAGGGQPPTIPSIGDRVWNAGDGPVYIVTDVFHTYVLQYTTPEGQTPSVVHHHVRIDLALT